MNRSIGSRLTQTFGVISLLIALSGVLVWVNLRDLGSLTVEAQQTVTAPLASLFEIEGRFLGLRILVREALLHPEADKLSVTKSSIDELVNTIELQNTDFARTVGGAARELVDDYDLAFERYRAELGTIVDLVKQHRVDEALVRVDGPGAAIADQALTALRKLVATEQALQATLMARQSDLNDRAQASVLAVTVFTLAATGLLAHYYRRRIGRPLADTTAIAQRFLSGEFSSPVPEDVRLRSDEIGRFGEALEALRLGLASQSIDTWVKEDVAAVSRRLQSQDDLSGFASKLVEEIARVTGVPYMSLYLVEDETGRLVRKGSAGATQGVGQSWESGEGLVGQCHSTGTPQAVLGNPETPLTVMTGLGPILLQAFMVWPISRPERNLGVLELGCLTYLNDQQVRWIETLLPFLAFNLELLERSLNTRALLDQSRHQAEELAVSEIQLKQRRDELLRSNQTMAEQAKQLEEQARTLSASEERSRLILESVIDGIWGMDTEGRVTFVNPAVERLLGFRPEALLGNSIHELVHHHRSDGRPYPLEECPMHQSLGDGMARTVNSEVLWTKSGRALPVEYTANPIWSDGKVTGVVVTFRDISRRLAAEARSRFALEVVEHGAALLWVEAGTYRVTYANSAACILLGFSSEELNGRRMVDFDLDAPSDQRMAELVNAAKISAAPQNFDSRYRTKHGAILHVELTVFVAETDGHSLLIINVKDVTDRRKIEGELILAKERAEEATRMKSDFLANMSHEIRTPMNAILGISHLALKTVMTAKQRDYLDKIRQAGQHLLAIINDILDFSKVEAGKLTLEAVPFELQKVLDQVTGVIAEKAAAKELEFLIRVGPDVPPFLVGDSLRVGQVLINYASNAVKFTEKGEIEVEVALVERREDEVRLRFQVKDSGMGMTEEQLGRLFQSFQQADTSTTRKFGGTGLGLAICKSLAELMGGDVGAQSQKGVGSTFWFTARLGVAATPSTAGAPSPDLRGRRVLVVDDHDKARLVLRDMLESLSFQVDEADSGPSALRLTEEAVAMGKPYSVVLLDWKMPGINGLETARALLALNLKPSPRVIMVTAYGREEVLGAADQANIDQVLAKPLSASALFDAIVHSLGYHAPAPPAALVPPPSTDLHGLKVLLVEDNEINQMVAQELLADAGVEVATAINGQEAIDWLAEHRCDVVLMDVQMPVMDGIAATRILRSRPETAQLPILAMTANALEIDRDRSLEAGMNDHIAKPIDPEVLFAAIKRWARRLPIDTELGLKRVRGKEALYRDLLTRFEEGQAGSVTAIRQALEDGDQSGAVLVAHTVKGLAATLGAVALSASAGRLEKQLKNNADVGLELTTFDAELSAVMAFIAGQRPTAAVTAETAPSEATSPRWTAAHTSLRNLLVESDSRALAALEADRELWIKSMGSAAYNELVGAVRVFEFERALGLLPATINDVNN